MDSKITIEVVKKNILLSLDKLVNQYYVKESDLRQVWENTETLWEYAKKAIKPNKNDEVTLLILTHNIYLNELLINYQNNKNYKIYKFNQSELKYFYDNLIK